MKVKLQCVLLFIWIFCTGCTENPNVQEQISSVQESQTDIPSAEKNFFAMDTYMDVIAYGEQAKEAVSQAQIRVEELDRSKVQM